MTPRPYDRFFDTVLARTDPERAHDAALRAIRVARPLLTRRGWRAESAQMAGRVGADGGVQAMGLTFPHPLGLAAGFDKNGVGIDALAALGFGHVEIGTVTALPQPGNPQPRLFRLPDDRAIVNRMGFNNDGAAVVARRLAARTAAISADSARHLRRVGTPSAPSRRRVVLGINIGKTKVVPEDDQAAVQADYETSAGLLAPYADYLVVNVSSPNTPGLRSLQSVERLDPLLRAVRRRAEDAAGRAVPLLVKIAPDLADDDVCAVAELALAQGLSGIIATNTTTGRDRLASDPAQVTRVGAGGLSGRPLEQRSLAVLRLLHDRVGDALTLVSVGGISTVEDVRVRLASGAALVQAYTGFVYGGPLWPRRIVSGLR